MDESKEEHDRHFEDLRLDEEFIRTASSKELSADDRRRRSSRLRETELERLRDARADRRPRRPYRRVIRGLAALRSSLIILTIVALLGFFFWQETDKTDLQTWASTPDVATSVDSDQWPPPSLATSREPLGTPDLSALGGVPYAFVELQNDSIDPVAYDPCRPIKIVVNGRTAPAEGQRLLTEAVDRVSVVTGLKFEIEGVTDEPPSAERNVFQRDRYGNRWAPILVAWTDPKEFAELEGDIAGVGGSSWVETSSENVKVYVSGQVALDGPQLADLIDNESAESARSVILHELGHLVGLDHVDDKSQVMNPEGDPDITEYQAGDRAGLARLGQGKCVKRL